MKSLLELVSLQRFLFSLLFVFIPVITLYSRDKRDLLLLKSQLSTAHSYLLFAFFYIFARSFMFFAYFVFLFWSQEFDNFYHLGFYNQLFFFGLDALYWLGIGKTRFFSSEMIIAKLGIAYMLEAVILLLVGMIIPPMVWGISLLF